MDNGSLDQALGSIPLGGVRYHETIGSTNDEALKWAAEGAPDLSIVIADEQTAGRGRLNRRWFTPKGTALAFSVILRPPHPVHLSRTVGLAAVSIANSCRHHGLDARIKWPNDILLDGRKVAGILIESVWSGDEVASLVVGIGINVGIQSIPPAADLQFPATAIENELGRIPDREILLREILIEIMSLRPRMDSNEFLDEWENYLAYSGETIQVTANGQSTRTGKLLGLQEDGGLRLLEQDGNLLTIHFGDVSLRPAA